MLEVNAGSGVKQKNIINSAKLNNLKKDKGKIHNRPDLLTDHHSEIKITNKKRKHSSPDHRQISAAHRSKVINDNILKAKMPPKTAVSLPRKLNNSYAHNLSTFG